MEPNFIALIKDFEKDFGIPEGYFSSFLKDDDWSFIIKIHALLEAVASQLLANATGDIRLQKVFDRLELSNKDTGKMAFLKALELLTKKQKAYIILISNIRNDVVHDIKNMNFNFMNYIANMDDNQKASFIDRIIYFDATDKQRIVWRDFTLSKPRESIYLATFYLIIQVHSKLKNIILEREYAAETIQSVKEMFEKINNEDTSQ